MAEPKEEDFLDDIDAAEADVFADEMEEIDDEALELDQLRAERDQLKDRFMRALADAENSRKRSEKDRREAENYGGSKLARDMLSVYDNMKRALEAATDEQREVSGALLEGIELTMGSKSSRRRLVTALTHSITKRCLKPPCQTPKRATSFRLPLKGSCCTTVCCAPRRLAFLQHRPDKKLWS
jgi:hypothetical protein